MTVDTEAKAVDFLRGMNAVFKRTGSREKAGSGAFGSAGPSGRI